MQNEIEKLIDGLMIVSEVYIYGAGDVGRAMAYCLNKEPFNIRIKAFVVSENISEQLFISSNIPIIKCDDADKDTLILVATMEKYREDIVSNLVQHELNNYSLLTYESLINLEIRKRCWFAYQRNIGIKPYEVGMLHSGDFISELSKELVIYVAKSDLDKSLKCNISNNKWEQDIQVGAALSEYDVADLKDNTGDNISSKNRQYCEMTALY